MGTQEITFYVNLFFRLRQNSTCTNGYTSAAAQVVFSYPDLLVTWLRSEMEKMTYNADMV